jgi:hypothetical protein
VTTSQDVAAKRRSSKTRKAKNTTRQGANFELQIMHHLSELGYDVLRSSGSRGKIDVVAVGDPHTLWIQAKISNPLLSPADRVAVIGVADRVSLHGDAYPVVAYRIRGKVCFRMLTGYGPRDFTDFRPHLHGHAICGTCGHQHDAHARGTGCWDRGKEDRSCGCASFILPSQVKKTKEPTL